MKDFNIEKFKEQHDFSTELRNNIDKAYQFIKDWITDNGGYVDFRNDNLSFIPTIFLSNFHNNNGDKPFYSPRFVLAAKVEDNEIKIAFSDNYDPLVKLLNIHDHNFVNLKHDEIFYKESVIALYFAVVEFVSTK